MSLPILGLMLGDAAGIGPEVCAKLVSSQIMRNAARLVVVGDLRVFKLGIKDAKVNASVETYQQVEDIEWSRSEIPFIDLGNLDPKDIPRGEVSANSGRASGETLAFMIGLALQGKIHGITFAPLNKAALNVGGWNYRDEHLMFADLIGHSGYFGEMNVIGKLWTSRVASHVPFRDISSFITKERVIGIIRLTAITLKSTGNLRPHIAVAALNPHAGEAGLLGDEEITIIRPAVEAVRDAGVDCEGPFPADTIFLKAFEGQYDAVVCMYHDQGQIATKLMGFNKGVTVTAGLKTVFTTPAHGTAFDIVGQGKADPSALEQAVRIASKLVSSRSPQGGI